MIKRSDLLIIFSYALLTACNQPDKKITQGPVAVNKRPEIMDPFRYHKLIEVSPGNDFDIVSWGRGMSSSGSFLVLHSDSAGKKYTTTTGDLDGTIVDVYNSDMDLDGNPEILIQAKATDTANYATIYAFEFSDNKAQKLDFPKLSTAQKKGYRGGDNFYIQEGKFMREFPVYDGNGKEAKPTGQKRLLEYGLRNNEFTVKQLSTDSTTTKTASTAPVRSTAPVVSSNTSTSKKKKHKSQEQPVHHKKKRHHRHSEE